MCECVVVLHGHIHSTLVWLSLVFLSFTKACSIINILSNDGSIMLNKAVKLVVKKLLFLWRQTRFTHLGICWNHLASREIVYFLTYLAKKEKRSDSLKYKRCLVKIKFNSVFITFFFFRFVCQ